MLNDFFTRTSEFQPTSKFQLNVFFLVTRVTNAFDELN